MKTYKAVIFDLFDTLVDFDRTRIPTVTIDGREIRSTAGETYKVLAQHAPHTTFETYYQALSAVISKSRRAVAMKCSAIVSECRRMPPPNTASMAC